MWWMHGDVGSLHLYFVGSSRAPLCSGVFYGQKVHEDYASVTVACYGKILHLTPRRYCGFCGLLFQLLSQLFSAAELFPRQWIPFFWQLCTQFSSSPVGEIFEPWLWGWLFVKVFLLCQIKRNCSSHFLPEIQRGENLVSFQVVLHCGVLCTGGLSVSFWGLQEKMVVKEVLPSRVW